MARFRSRLPRCPAHAGLIRSAARPPYGELPGYARLAFLGVPLTAARLTKRSTGRHCACSKTFGFLQARATGQLTVGEKNMNTDKNISSKTNNCLKVLRDRSILLVSFLASTIYLLEVLHRGLAKLLLLPTVSISSSLFVGIIIFLLTFLLLYIYKFRKLRKYILTTDPHFEDHMKFDYWFEYYAKQAEKHK